MATIAAIALAVADSWSISVGGGWIAVMLIGMALCCVGMLAFMWLMRDGRGWLMCGRRGAREAGLTFLDRPPRPGDRSASPPIRHQGGSETLELFPNGGE